MKSRIAIFILTLCLVGSLASCSDDDDSNYDYTSSWNVTCSVDPRTSMTITSQVQGLSSKVSENDKMAAFVGGECRGVVSPSKMDSSFYFLLMVNMKQPDDDQIDQPIELRYYSANEDKVYKCTTTNLKLTRDLSVGSIDDPYKPTLTAF